MKVYLLYSKKMSTGLLQQLEKVLTELGYNILPRKQVDDEIKTYNFEQSKAIVRENDKNIKTCDIVIAECSYNSSSLGYQIATAVENKKPVIALYNMSAEIENPGHISRVPITLKGNDSKYLMLKQYDLQNFKKIVSLAVKDAAGLIDTKFILIIPPVIDRYLEWNVREKSLSKAEVTRDAIEKVMADDKRYQTYLKESGLAE